MLALRNGTIGWSLAGLELDHGQDRRAPEVPPDLARRAEAAAWDVARKAGAGRISAAALASLLDRGTQTVYRFDVRSPEDYAAGHLAGFRSAPGGQLVQETDWFAPVRGALVVLAGDGGGRAAMTASWLAQMGWEVAVLSRARTGRRAGPGRTGTIETGPWVPAWPPAPEPPQADPAQVEGWLREGGTAVIDVDSSRLFEAGHVPGAAWALRTDLAGPPAGLPPGLPGWAARPAGLDQRGRDAGPLRGRRRARRDRGAGPGGRNHGWARSGRPWRRGPA